MAKHRKRTLGEKLVGSAREAVEIERGEREPARISQHTAARSTVQPPPEYGAQRIREIRARMRLSQSVFADALNVSAETIRAWEQGKREPDGPTLRLLEVAEQYPEVFLKKVHLRHERMRSTGHPGGV